MGPALGAALGLLVCLTGAQAQLYTLKDVKIPGNRSLNALYVFFVYSQEEAPDQSAGKPFVKFSGLESHSTNPSVPDASLSQYKGVQLTVMRYSDFWKIVDPKRFCSTYSDVASGRSKDPDTLLLNPPSGEKVEDMAVYTTSALFPSADRAPQHDISKVVEKTGVYILILSNCGLNEQATVSGTVVVKNAYGFLPGDEFHKMPFYGWLLLVYVLLAVAWMALSIRWWRELFNIQHCISGVICAGLLESFIWYILYHEWNGSGTRNTVLFVISILLSVVKNTLSYVLVLVASLGWGVTVPFLDSGVACRVQAVSCLYIILEFIRELVLSFSHSHSLSLAFVLLCMFPVSILNGSLFYWVFSALSGLMETLQERRQYEKLALFQQLWRVLVLALVAATGMLVFQVYTVSRSVVVKWKYQWLLTDGISHGIFLFVLMCIMFLWAPNKSSQRYAYSQQIGGHEPDSGCAQEMGDGAVWADEGGPDEDQDREDGDSFWASTHKEEGGEVIGRR